VKPGVEGVAFVDRIKASLKSALQVIVGWFHKQNFRKNNNLIMLDREIFAGKATRESHKENPGLEKRHW